MAWATPLVPLSLAQPASPAAAAPDNPSCERSLPQAEQPMPGTTNPAPKRLAKARHKATQHAHSTAQVATVVTVEKNADQHHSVMSVLLRAASLDNATVCGLQRRVCDFFSELRRTEPPAASLEQTAFLAASLHVLHYDCLSSSTSAWIKARRPYGAFDFFVLAFTVPL